MQAELVSKLATTAASHPKDCSLAYLKDEEIEAMLWDYPHDASEPLVLFALMTHPKSPGKPIPHEEFDVWLSSCSSRLCLEWLKRQGVILRYTVEEKGASWQANPDTLTTAFVDALESRHEALHRFASYVLRDALRISSN